MTDGAKRLHQVMVRAAVFGSSANQNEYGSVESRIYGRCKNIFQQIAEELAKESPAPASSVASEHRRYRIALERLREWANRNKPHSVKTTLALDIADDALNGLDVSEEVAARYLGEQAASPRSPFDQRTPL